MSVKCESEEDEGDACPTVAGGGGCRGGLMDGKVRAVVGVALSFCGYVNFRGRQRRHIFFRSRGDKFKSFWVICRLSARNQRPMRLEWHPRLTPDCNPVFLIIPEYDFVSSTQGKSREAVWDL